MSIEQKIADIEAEMAKTQKNKATMGHLGLLKARIAKLKLELLAPSASGGKTGEGFDVSKSGNARVGFIGFPSVGKSTLLTKLTNTVSEAADYEFTTLTCVPGSMVHNGCKIQLLDLPGIIEGAKDGKGRGKQVIGVARTCDMLLIILDATKPMRLKNIIERELEGFGIRLNKSPPNISFTKKPKGGICVFSEVPQSRLTNKHVVDICREFGVVHAEVVLRCDATVDQLIDAVHGNRAYIPALYVLNKVDNLSLEEMQILSMLEHFVAISADQEWNFEELKNNIYTSPNGEIPDFENPFIMRRGSRTVKDLCLMIHRGIMEKFKSAMVWGASVKHSPKVVGKNHILNDEDVIQIVWKKST